LWRKEFGERAAAFEIFRGSVWATDEIGTKYRWQAGTSQWHVEPAAGASCIWSDTDTN
jgi:hypothetical protein